MKRALLMLMVCAAVGFAAVARADPPASGDPDTTFAAQLHSVGIYGPRDYNAWIGKIACKRLDRGLDADAYASAKFVSMQLPKGSSTEQAWQFVGLAIPTYCPDKQYVLQQAAGQPVAPPADPNQPALPAEQAG